MTQVVIRAQDEKAFDPNRLLDFLKDNLHLSDDRALCHRLDMAPVVLQHIRARKTPLGGLLLLRMAEVAKCDVVDLRQLMGDRRKKIRVTIPGGILRASSRNEHRDHKLSAD
jgi:hypothetical protein